MSHRSCAILGCTAAGSEDAASYFCIPEDQKLRESWLKVCRRDRQLYESDCATEELFVCSRHFDQTDFVQEIQSDLLGLATKRVRLKHNSVPHKNVMKIKEEPVDLTDLCDQAPIVWIPHGVRDKGGKDRNLWISKNLDSSTNSVNEQESNSLVTTTVSDQSTTSHQPQNSSSCVSIQHAPSSLPASQTWPGGYNFTVSFGPQEKNTKGISWTYSKTLDKLYVRKDSPCPINFSANAPLPHGVQVRVMALYTSPEQVSEIVKRCFNHSYEDVSKGVPEAEHLIRCESVMATYHEDVSTGRHSVVVPFENPPIGQQYSTYILKFACFGSCAGGPNRRPLMLIFTLEKNNQVIGRRKLDVKICACPGRDRKIDETQHAKIDSICRGSLKRKDSSSNFTNLSDTLSFTKSVNYPPSKKSKTLPDKDGNYTIYADNKECYEFLIQMKKFYEVCKIMEDLSPEITKALLNYQKKK